MMRILRLSLIVVVFLSLVLSAVPVGVSNSWFSDQSDVDITISSNWVPDPEPDPEPDPIPDIPISTNAPIGTWEVVSDLKGNSLILKAEGEFIFHIGSYFSVTVYAAYGFTILSEERIAGAEYYTLTVVVVPTQ